MNTVMAIKYETNCSNGDYEAVASRKECRMCFDCMLEFIQQLQDKVMENPCKGFYTLMREMGIGITAMKLVLNENLCYYSYKRHKGQILTAKVKVNHLIKTKKLLNNLMHPFEPGIIWFLSNEKNFCQDRLHTIQKNRWFVYNQCGTPCIIKSKFSKTVMVFGCVSWEGDVKSLHIFEQGLRLYSNCNVKLLETLVKLWLEMVAVGRPYVWQQDLVPCHTSKKGQKWLLENFYDFTLCNIWLLNSTNCNPINYYVWVWLRKIPTALKSKMVFKDLPREIMRKFSARFCSCLDIVMEVEGSYFE